MCSLHDSLSTSLRAGLVTTVVTSDLVETKRRTEMTLATMRETIEQSCLFNTSPCLLYTNYRLLTLGLIL